MRSLVSAIAAFALCSLFTQDVRAQEIILFEDFENGFANWTATGLWNPEREDDFCGAHVAPFPSSNQCAWYGIDGACDYDTGASNFGYLTYAASIVIPATGPRLNLRLTTLRDMERNYCKYDYTAVQFSSNGGATWASYNLCNYGLTAQSPTWFTKELPLTNSYFGHPIKLRFMFSSVDKLFNETLGWFIDDVSLRVEAGSFACRGTCPACSACTACAGGCLNSLHQSAELAGSGFPTVSADSLVLTAHDLTPTSMVVFLQGHAFSSGGVPFGDGRLCVSTNVVRLGFKACPDGIVSYPGPSDTPIALQGFIPIGGGTWYYQVLYRDAGDYCTSAQLNATNGYRIDWTP